MCTADIHNMIKTIYFCILGVHLPGVASEDHELWTMEHIDDRKVSHGNDRTKKRYRSQGQLWK